MEDVSRVAAVDMIPLAVQVEGSVVAHMSAILSEWAVATANKS